MLHECSAFHIPWNFVLKSREIFQERKFLSQSFVFSRDFPVFGKTSHWKKGMLKDNPVQKERNSNFVPRTWVSTHFRCAAKKFFKKNKKSLFLKIICVVRKFLLNFSCAFISSEVLLVNLKQEWNGMQKKGFFVMSDIFQDKS